MSIPAISPLPQPLSGPWGAAATRPTAQDTQVSPAPTTPEVDAIGALPFTGTLIPHAWYTALTLPSGKPDLVAITLLADIVYWYRPVVERDPATGEILRQRKKFKADMLQRSYQAFAAQFGFTKRQVREALGRLAQTGVIRKEFRHLDTPYGRCANVLFLAPIPAQLRAITCGVNTPSPDSSTDVSRSSVTRLTPDRRTNTESTPENSQESSLLEDDFSSLLKEEEEVIEKEAEVITDENEVPAEQTAAPPSRDTPLPAEDASPPASPAVVVPLFPGKGTRPRQHRPGPHPVAVPGLDTPRAPTTPVPPPAPALPWWAATQRAAQEEARWRAAVAALPVAEHAQLTQQARQDLTRQGVPAWMQIGPVIEAAMWERQTATSAPAGAPATAGRGGPSARHSDTPQRPT
jgi:hypothetical protein